MVFLPNSEAAAGFFFEVPVRLGREPDRWYPQQNSYFIESAILQFFFISVCCGSSHKFHSLSLG
ncbi:hypothetical protein LEP1GSC058_2454 [Leptospira fainei serovar Hurstbridge str. BUT 6]|uniref:Uncharacterized protein n=1 Tax=Leptospira fainei serovar Hurstbridge str. BUT 6 TaxID=1193011 RepID=S3UR75_9LEPT|nr:hypothetical protein LEP1GSC058_2454 [Leptospira fainei serovar Hurstbridge str. BUT 6]